MASTGARIALEMSGGLVWQAETEATAGAPITLAIGPEGGFEPSEVEQLVAGGFTLCTLGPSILRFETAAVSAVALARWMLLRSSGDHPHQETL